MTAAGPGSGFDKDDSWHLARDLLAIQSHKALTVPLKHSSTLYVYHSRTFLSQPGVSGLGRAGW